MKNLVSLAAAFFFAALTVGENGQAAERLPDPPVVELPSAKQFGGWYLRGDVSRVQADDFGTTFVGNSFTRSEIDEGYNFGIGAGYQFNDYFRADVTLERFASDFNGASVGNCAFIGATAIPGSCTSVETADFTAWSVMANAYVDLGNFAGFTPYAGAGIGASYVSWENYQSVDTCTRANVATTSCFPGTASFVAPGAGGTATTRTTAFDGDKSWKFSYALMAGVSYDISENLKVDVGYKYTNIASGALVNDIGGGASVDHEKIGIHAVRVGLRYLVW